jgi:hypothetical protein
MLTWTVLLLSAAWPPPPWFWEALKEPDPPERDMGRFPTEETADAVVNFETARLAYLDKQRSLWPDRDFQGTFDAAIADCRERRDAWCALAAARQCMRYGGGCRTCQVNLPPGDTPPTRATARQALARLRSMVGREAFDLGEMPAPVPACWWRPID